MQGEGKERRKKLKDYVEYGNLYSLMVSLFLARHSASASAELAFPLARGLQPEAPELKSEGFWEFIIHVFLIKL